MTFALPPNELGVGSFFSLPPQNVAGNHPNFHLLGFRASALNSQPQDIHSEGCWLELDNPSIQWIFFGWLRSCGIGQPSICKMLVMHMSSGNNLWLFKEQAAWRRIVNMCLHTTHICNKNVAQGAPQGPWKATGGGFEPATPPGPRPNRAEKRERSASYRGRLVI